MGLAFLRSVCVTLRSRDWMHVDMQEKNIVIRLLGLSKLLGNFRKG